MSRNNFLFIISLMVLMNMALSPPTSATFLESFERFSDGDIPSGWEKGSTADQLRVREGGVDASNFMLRFKDGNTQRDTATVKYSGDTRPNSYSFYLTGSRSSNGCSGTASLTNESGTPAVTVGIASTEFCQQGPGSRYKTKNKWIPLNSDDDTSSFHKFKFYFDWDNKTLDLYVDGLLEARNRRFTNPSVKELSNLRLTHDTDSAVRLDEIRRNGEGFLNFSGMEWVRKDSKGETISPGSNFWSDSSASVRTDTQGRLQLTIRQAENGDTWYSSEVWSVRDVGPGTYTWTVTDGAATMDKRIVLGMFLYESDTQELDIELSEWNGLSSPKNGQYVVQPHESNEPYQFQYDEAEDTHMTHRISWKKNQEVKFQSVDDHYNNFSKANLLSDQGEKSEWSRQSSDVPQPTQTMKMHTNMWIYPDTSTAPSNGETYGITVDSVEFESDGTRTRSIQKADTVTILKTAEKHVEITVSETQPEYVTWIGRSLDTQHNYNREYRSRRSNSLREDGFDTHFASSVKILPDTGVDTGSTRVSFTSHSPDPEQYDHFTVLVYEPDSGWVNVRNTTGKILNQTTGTDSVTFTFRPPHFSHFALAGISSGKDKGSSSSDNEGSCLIARTVESGSFFQDLRNLRDYLLKTPFGRSVVTMYYHL